MGMTVSSVHYKYGENSYATYIGSTQAAVTVLGSTEASARKQVSTSQLPLWNANWRLCTEMWVSLARSRTSSSAPCATITYGTHAKTQDVITSASGYSSVTIGDNRTTPYNYVGDCVYEFGWQTQGAYSSRDTTNRGKGYADGNVYMRRVTQ